MSKLINISNEIYSKLRTMKRNDESFTIVIENLLEKRTNKEAVLAFAGKGGIDEEKIKSLKKGWARWTKKYV